MRNSIRFIIGIIILNILSGCGSKEMEKAKDYMDASMYSEAISLLQIEIQDSPKNAEASFLLGQCLLEINEDFKAEEVFKRSILLETEYKEKVGEIYFTLALNSYKENSLRKADKFYEDAIKYNPLGKEKFSEQLFSFGVQVSEANTNSDNAIEIFEDVTKINPTYKEQVSDITYNLAKSFIEKGFINDGFNYAKLSIKNDPKHIKDISNLYFSYANSMLLDQDKSTESINYFSESIRLNNNLKKSVAEKFKEIAEKYENENDFQKALYFAEKSADLESSNNFYYQELKNKYKPKMPEEGLIAFYPFNGNAMDESGYSNNATVNTASLTTDRNGKYNSAYSFNGSSKIVFPTYNFPVSNSTRSISVWVYSSDFGQGNKMIIGWGSPSSLKMSAVGIGHSYKKNQRPFFWGYGADLIANTRFKNNNWHHIVITYSDNILTIFIDGIEDTKKTLKLTTTSNRNLYVGWFNSTLGGFYGSIDDILIYKRKLSPNEVVQLYNMK